MTELSLQESIAKEMMPLALQHEKAKLTKWQKRLRPLMVRMIVGLTLFFFAASFVQLGYLHWSIGNSPKLDLRESLSLLSLSANPTNQEIAAAAKLKALVTLEAASLQRNYHQANVLLMSRVWTGYLGFVTGMILALVGATFILGRLQETTSELNAKTEVTELSLKSASPGLILALLGVTLMLATTFVNHRIEVKDTAVYIYDVPAASPIEPLTLPPPLVRPQLPGDDLKRLRP